MDMNIQKYMALVKTVEYGSFTKAAEILNYSQSGLIRIGTFSSAATHWLLFCRKIILWYTLRKFLLRLSVMSHLCFWRKVRKQKYQRYLNVAT